MVYIHKRSNKKIVIYNQEGLLIAGSSLVKRDIWSNDQLSFNLKLLNELHCTKFYKHKSVKSFYNIKEFKIREVIHDLNIRNIQVRKGFFMWNNGLRKYKPFHYKFIGQNGTAIYVPKSIFKKLGV